MDNIELQSLHSSLPTEVEENVIDYVSSADDITTLRHCALTCRDWLPRSRIHLFSAIRLSTLEDTYSFCDFLDTYPQFRMLIRSIIMAPNVSEKKPACLLETFPVQLLSRLPKLRGWELRNDVASDGKRNISHHPIILRNLRLKFSPIVDLNLGSLNFTSLTAFLRFITSFARLRHLQCNDVRFDQEGGLKPYGIGKLNLTRLQVGGIPSDALCTLLDRTASTLENLAIASRQDVDGVSLVLSQTSVLKSLTFDIQHKTDWDMIAKAISGASILSLRSFRANIANLDDLWHLERNGANNLVSTFLEMKLQSFTINVCAEKVQPISTTFRTMALFAQLSGKGLYPQLVFTGATFLDESHPATSIAISPDSQLVAGIGKEMDGSILLWNISHNASVRSWHINRVIQPLAVQQVVFSPDNERLLIVGKLEGTSGTRAYVQDLKQQCCVATIECDSLFAAWSPDGLVFLLRTGALSTWDPAMYQAIQEYDAYRPRGGRERWRGALFFSPDHRWLAAYFQVDTRRKSTICILFRVFRRKGKMELSSFKLLEDLDDRGLAEFPTNHCFGKVAFDPASTQIAVSDSPTESDVQVHIWDITQESPLKLTVVFIAMSTMSDTYRHLSRSRPVSFKLAFSRDSRHLFFLRIDEARKLGPLIRFCAKTGVRMQDPSVLKGMLGSIPPDISCELDTYQFSPCGRFLIASPLTGGIMVWKTSDGSLVRRVA